MHGHTPGTNTLLLIAKMIDFVGNLNFSQISIWHIEFIHLYVYFNTYTLPCIESILSTFQCSWGYEPSIEMGIVSEVDLCP